MFCSFGAAPRILRLFCRGKVVEKGNKTFNTLVERMIDSGMKMDKEILEAGLSSGDEDEEARPMKMSMKGIRAVIVLHVFKVQTSCGFGVPVFPRSKGDKSEYDTLGAGMVNGLPPNHNISAQSGGPMKLWDDRPTMPAWASKMSAKNALEKYRESNNWRSLDGCPGLTAARKDRGQWLMVEQVRVRTSRMAVGQWDAFIFGILLALFTFSVGWKLGVIELRM